MKKLLSFIILIQMVALTSAVAQLDGKRFISGSAGINFSNSNPDLAKASHFYGYDFNLGIGKFKSETRASGWNLSSTLSGNKSYFTGRNGELQVDDGISAFRIGAGHFWQYYKHFSSKFGIYAGPAIDGSYTRSNEITPQEDEIYDKISNSVSVTFAVNAGLYYQMSDRWWLTASLGFATPFTARYEFVDLVGQTSNSSYKSHGFIYQFSPAFTLPSVGLGLRYFLTN